MYNGSRTPYGTKVTYSCGLGRQLLQYTYDDEILYNSTQYECQWDRTWYPEREVDARNGLAAAHNRGGNGSHATNSDATTSMSMTVTLEGWWH